MNMFYRLEKNINRLLVALVLCCATIISCNKKTTATFGTAINIPKKILALGDSYTIGQSVNEEERFINKTIANFNSSGLNVKYPAQIIAQTGWTTKNLLDAIATNTNNFTAPYDIVTLLIGVNNQYQHLDTANYRNEFAACLQKALTLTGNRTERVFVLSIPDYGATPFGAGNAIQIALEIDQFNAINKQVTLQMGINYTDITPSSRMAATDIHW